MSAPTASNVAPNCAIGSDDELPVTGKALPPPEAETTTDVDDVFTPSVAETV
jgi:hypothetical protein